MKSNYDKNRDEEETFPLIVLWTKGYQDTSIISLNNV